MVSLFSKLEENNCSMGVKFTKYEGAVPQNIYKHLACKTGSRQLIAVENILWQVDYRLSEVESNPNAIDCSVTFIIVKGDMLQGNVSIDLAFDNWSKENYILMPAAAYNGNRFKAAEKPYPPMLTEEDEIGVDIPLTITDVPRLNINEGQSRIQLRMGDMSTPAIGFHSPISKSGFFMLAEQNTSLGDSGIEIEEKDDRKQAIITLSAPAVRHDYKYSMCNTGEMSDDKGYDFHENDEVMLRFRLYFFGCMDIPGLFHYFIKIRKDITGKVSLQHQIPFSEAWNIVEKKYNDRNWVEAYEFYKSSEADSSIFRQWQTGWVGGAVSTYPSIFAGNELSKERAWKTLDFLFKKLQAPTGYFYGIFCDGGIYGDCFYHPENVNWVLLRKNADVIYFLVKQFMLIEKMSSLEVPDHWKLGLEKACDAFVRLWEKYKQFGQFIDIDKEQIIIGGSAGAAIAPAALALAYQYFHKEEYIQAAEAAADYYFESFVKKGITNGAPGEILQCPDSESAFGLLESYMVLYEVTDSRKYVDMGCDTANICATWCVSYDFKFPAASEFNKIKMQAAGAVWANVQNKHAAPGICTLSGLSLFKLYRATGDRLYLELIQEIAHNLPQFISREDRPLRISWDNNLKEEYNPVGRINERVNMSDWEGKQNIGALPCGSCWCEVSSMLTFVEIPGVYIQKDNGFVFAIDHVDAAVVEKDEEKMVVELYNPTKFTARLKLFIEDSSQMSKPMGENALYGCREAVVAPFSKERIVL